MFLLILLLGGNPKGFKRLAMQAGLQAATAIEIAAKVKTAEVTAAKVTAAEVTAAEVTAAKVTAAVVTAAIVTAAEVTATVSHGGRSP